jgi:hypothetical protein
MKYLVFLMYSFWVPQIVYCARHDARQPLRPVYIIGITLTRLALPLYVFGCPRNILRVAPAPWVCVSLCASIAFQVSRRPDDLCLSVSLFPCRWSMDALLL